MNQEAIFLNPVFQERIWGGTKLKSMYDYAIPTAQTGEAWVISAHPNGPSVIANGALKGLTLADAWRDHGELFNKAADNQADYPLLVKLLDANDDLSVQVHPDDTYARDVEGVPYGKTECWYIVSAEAGAELIIGHHATSRTELEEKIAQGEWDALLKRIPVKAGDFVHVPSGTIHAIGKGIVILEIQQSSDITYRLYDYDRVDDAGNKRELHLDKSAQVTNVPDNRTIADTFAEKVTGDLTTKRLVEDAYFTVEHCTLAGEADCELETDFLQVDILAGSGTLVVADKTYPLEKGMHFILPHTIKAYTLSGELEFVVSWV